MRDAFSTTLLKQYEVMYHQCPECGLLRTEAPFWLDEAYADAIAVADTGLLARNVSLAARLAVLLYLRFDPRASYLDVAGGYGMLTRLMRDYGFEYFWDDRYCRNLLARGFEADQAGRPFAAMTAFEVLEHVHDPAAFVIEQFGKYACSTLIFTTELYGGNEPPAKDWWYYAFSTGQHITFCRRTTLEKLAARLNLNFYSVRGLHVLTDRDLRIDLMLRFVTGRIAPLLALLVRRKLGSRTLTDHYKLIGRTDQG